MTEKLRNESFIPNFSIPNINTDDVSNKISQSFVDFQQKVTNIPNQITDLTKIQEEFSNKFSHAFNLNDSLKFEDISISNSMNNIISKFYSGIEETSSYLNSIFGKKNPISATLEFYFDTIELYVSYALHQLHISSKNSKQYAKTGVYVIGGGLLGGIGYLSYKALKFSLINASRDPTAIEWFEIGNRYISENESQENYRKALSCYFEASKLNHLPSKLKCAEFYRIGLGCERNLDLSFKFYKEIAKISKNSEAHFQLAELIIKGYPKNNELYIIPTKESEIDVVNNHKLEKAYQHYLIACDGGHSQALFRLATWYDRGYYVNLDKEKAFQLYISAAQNGWIAAMKEVSKRLENGVGCSKDLNKAKLWKIKSKINESVNSQS